MDPNPPPGPGQPYIGIVTPKTPPYSPTRTSCLPTPTSPLDPTALRASSSDVRLRGVDKGVGAALFSANLGDGKPGVQITDTLCDGKDYSRTDPTWTPSAVSSWNPAALLDPRHHALQPGPPTNSAPLSLPTTFANGSTFTSYGGGNGAGMPGMPVPFTAQGNANVSRPPSSAGQTPNTAQNVFTFQFIDAGTDDGYLSAGDAVSKDFLGRGKGNGSLLGMGRDGGPSRGPSRPSTPLYVQDQVGTPTNGMVSMIERNFLLQDRQDVPDPKRRKVGLDETMPAKGSFGNGNGILADSVREAAAKAEEMATTGPEIAPLALSGPPMVDLTDGLEKNMPNPIGGYSEVCFGSVLGVKVNCHKTPAPKPGAQSIAGPAYWPTVKVVLKRIEGDPTNSIQVYDHTRSVFGVLEKRSGDCLAPLMDVAKVHLRTDAKIVQRRKQEDEVVGQPTQRAFNIELVLYGSAMFVRIVGRRLNKFGLRLVRPTHLNDGIPLALSARVQPVNDHAPAAVPLSVQAAAASYVQSRYPLVNNTPLKTMEELRSEVLSVFDSMANAEDLPEMEPCSDVRTPLLHHQKQGLYFMINREKPLVEQANTKLSASIWQKKVLPNNTVTYYNIITNQMDSQPPSESLGGILADMMGLGKTLSILSLIATTKPLAQQWVDQRPVQPVAPDAPARFDVPYRASLPLTQLKHNGRGTLLVCPLSTITNWEDQIKAHLAPNSLSFYIYHGPNRTKDAALLSKYDLVITTYGSVSSELTARSRGKKGGFPLEEIGWFRVVLDEAHMIREQATLQFKAICRLQASRRWAVTGTPVQNRLEDLGSLLAFLRLRPFDDRGKFTQYIVTPFRACDPNILPQLRILVDTITLRRLKDKIDLPKRTDTIVRLDFSADESRLYGFFAQNAQDRLQVLTSAHERLPGGKTYIHILQAILRLRLICAHGRELLSEDDLQLMRGTTLESAIDLDDNDDEATASAKPPPTESLAYELFDLMNNTDEDKCISCKRKLGGGVADDTAAATDNIQSEKQEDIAGYMTPCFHMYCPNCVKNFRDAERSLSYRSKQPGTCPVCQSYVVFSCTELRHDRADTEHDAPPLRKAGEGYPGPQASNAAGPSSSSPSSAPPQGTAAAAGGGNSGSGSGKTINEAAYSGPHTKTRALVAELLRHKAESAATAGAGAAPIKSVVFSGWTSHLDLIQLALDREGIRHCRLDGRMSRTARAQAMETFRTAADVHVILVSIMAGGLGLNLTAGNNVYVMEPQYNPAAEAQAIDRVHRLGQTRPVHTVRYIMRGSIEESMLKIQEKKIKLANLSMERADRKNITAADMSRQHLEDLRSLFR